MPLARLSSGARLKKYGHPLLMQVKLSVVGVHLVEPKVHGAHIAFRAHKSLRYKVVNAMEDASEKTGWWPTEIQGYNVRPIRGGKSWSLHSWALAWDVFGATGSIDPVTGRHRAPDDWFEVMETHGFVWGGRWKRPDPHHVEYPY